MKEFQIRKNEAGQRLDKYLHKLLPKANDGFVYKMLRKKNIVLNGKKAAGSERITAGDCVTLYFSDETFEKFSAVSRAQAAPVTPSVQMPDIIYEDDDILAVSKPAGMLSQKAAAGDISANELIIQYLLESGAVTREELRTFRPSVCNRLDRNTSGILVAGKTLHGLRTMSGQLKDRSVKKYYRCIVQGNLEKPQHLKGWLCKDHEKNQVCIYQDRQPDSQYIETEYRPLQQYNGYTLLEVHLITGRSHQIRAHLASAGHPLAGDPKYGDPQINRRLFKQAGLRRQLLHAYRLVLEDGTEITAPLPAEFKAVEEVLRGMRHAE